MLLLSTTILSLRNEKLLRFHFTTIHSTGTNVYVLERIDLEANEVELSLYWLYCLFDSYTNKNYESNI